MSADAQRQRPLAVDVEDPPPGRRQPASLGVAVGVAEGASPSGWRAYQTAMRGAHGTSFVSTPRVAVEVAVQAAWLSVWVILWAQPHRRQAPALCRAAYAIMLMCDRAKVARAWRR